MKGTLGSADGTQWLRTRHGVSGEQGGATRGTVACANLKPGFNSCHTDTFVGLRAEFV